MTEQTYDCMVSRLNSRMFIRVTAYVYTSVLIYNISSLFMPSGRLEDSDVSFCKASIRSNCAIFIDSMAELLSPDRQQAGNETIDSFMP